MSDGPWIEQGDSPHAYEREALAWVRSWFPQHEPWRAFARFTFVGSDGRDHEIDLLVACPAGCFLIEIKGYEGRIEGNARDLVSVAGTYKQAFDHPKRLLTYKMHKLIEALKSAKAYKDKHARPPFIDTLVFMSHAASIAADPSGACGLLLRDADDGQPQVRPGLRAALLEQNAPWMTQLAAGERRIDKPAAKLLAAAIKQIGYFGPKPPRVAGSWQLSTEPFEQTSVWSNYEAVHKLTRETRTVRIYMARRDAPVSRARLHNLATLEFEALQTFEHPGVLRAFEIDECDSGSAIVFENSKSCVRLDHFMLTRGTELDFRTRLALVRQLCEAVSAAHDRGVAHRALTPAAVLIADPQSERPIIKLRNWFQRVRTDESKGGIKTFGGETIVDLAPESDAFSDAERCYLAPELRQVGEPGGIAADIYSLGVLACLILAGAPPAQTLVELDGVLRQSGHLFLSQMTNGVSAGLERFVMRSAHVSPLHRATTAKELLESLDEAEADLDGPKAVVPKGPDDLVQGSVIDGGVIGPLQIVRRLGAGGTAIGFEATADDTAYALKVARDVSMNERIEAEARLLSSLDSNYIVRLAAPAMVGGSRALVLKPFGRETLHDYLKREGTLQLEFLERWGDQLLQALEHLEQKGRSHRDIKPGNIAVTDRGIKQALQIALFDFSLAGLSAGNLQAGTPGYIDPFLGDGARNKWDNYAERYSVAVTLYEMATGVVVQWGDGKTLPKLLKDAELPNLEPDRLPEEVRGPLLEFFEKSLHRDVKRRFDGATAMRDAWSQAMKGVAASPGAPLEQVIDASQTVAALESAQSAAGLKTLVAGLPLSTRAANALSRLGVDTLQDLLNHAPSVFRWLPGVGAKTQRELIELHEAAGLQFPGIEPTIRSLSAAGAVSLKPALVRIEASKRTLAQLAVGATIEQLATSLLARNRDGSTPANEALAAYLGLANDPAGESRSEAGSLQASATRTNVSRQAVYASIDAAVKRWRKNDAFMHTLDLVPEIVSSHGGVMTMDELGSALASRLPSDRPGDSRQRVAAWGVAMAMVEAEKRSPSNKERFELRRVERMMFVCDPTVDGVPAYAAGLGQEADRLADPSRTDVALPSAATAIAALRARPVPPGMLPLGNERLLALAAAASHRTCMNSRGEIYPRGLAVRRALRLAHGALAGLGAYDRERNRRVFTTADVRLRLASRYPEAEPLPAVPECVPLIQEALGDSVTYDAALDQFLVRAADTVTVQTGSAPIRTMHVTQLGAQPLDGRQQALARAARFEKEVHDALADRRLLVLPVQPAQFGGAIPQIAQQFDLQVISLDQLVVQGLRVVAQDRRIDFNKIRAADAHWPSGHDSDRLAQVLAEVMVKHVRPAVLQPARPILICDWGLVLRYRLDALYTELRDACGAGAHPGAVCVVPADDAEQTVVLDARQFPEFDGGRIVRVPGAWLRRGAA